MKRTLIFFSILAFVSVSFGSVALAQYSPQATDSSSQPSSLLAATAASSDSIGLDKIKDSVLRIGVELTGTFTVPPWEYDERTGTFGPSNDPTDGTDVSITAYRVGSGFVVDASGYIITNAHVVDTSYEAMVADLWNEYSQEILFQLAQTYFDLTPDQLTALSNAYLDYESINGTWSGMTYNVVVFNPSKTDAVGDIQKLFKNGWSAEIKKVGQPYPQIGKDVAVIKIESGKPFAPVTLGNSSSITAGSSVFVIGYPTVADLSDKSFLVPTVTSGIVSAVKPSDLGDYKVIQVDAGIAGGNSGGPVLNNKGQAIGVATFGATQNDGYNWALPIELVKEYLNELNITPRMTTNVGVFGFINKISSTILAALALFFFLTTCALLVIVLVKRKSHVIVSAPVAAPLAPNPFPPPAEHT